MDPLRATSPMTRIPGPANVRASHNRLLQHRHRMVWLRHAVPIAGIASLGRAAVKRHGAVNHEALNPRSGVTPAMLWAKASHDLRQPIQALLLLTRTLAGASEDATLRRSIEHMDQALYGLQGKLELLADLSRIEAPELRLCSLAPLHGRVMKEMESIAEQHGIGLRSRNPQGVVWSDAKLLTMVLRSLVMNAIRLGDGGDLLVAWRQRGGHVRLEVYFKAPPISTAQAQGAMIELRHRTDGRPSGEVGLGLGFVSHLCGLLGRHLEHTPLPASGHRFAVSLPLGASRANVLRS
jgi:signal transduction histidine kinase